jgi:hypothetical protein
MNWLASRVVETVDVADNRLVVRNLFITGNLKHEWTLMSHNYAPIAQVKRLSITLDVVIHPQADCPPNER